MNRGKMHSANLPPAFLIYAGAAIFGLIGWIAWGQFRARLKPANWLLRCNGDGVIIKYRSFENWRFPADDIQAVGLEYSEMAEIRVAREERTSPSLDANHNTQTQRLIYLDFCLRNADTAKLEAYLQAEQKTEPPGNFKTIFRDYPVEVLPGGIIRVRWSMSGGYKTIPSLQAATQYLSQYVKVAAEESTKVDLSYHRDMTPEEADAKILKLAKSGDRMGAVKLAQQVRHCTLTEAVAFVDKLTG
jgi:hypothetical protein